MQHPGIELRLHRADAPAAPVLFLPPGIDGAALDELVATARATVVRVSPEGAHVRRAGGGASDALGAGRLVADGWELSSAPGGEVSLVDTDEWLGPELVVVATGRRVRLPDGEGAALAIGRHLEGDLVLQDKQVSRHHARIVHEGGGHYLQDLGSRSGTYVNDEPQVGERRRLVHLDEIRVGRTRLAYQAPLEALAAKTRQARSRPAPEPREQDRASEPAHAAVSAGHAPAAVARRRAAPPWEDAVLVLLVALAGALFAFAAKQIFA